MKIMPSFKNTPENPEMYNIPCGLIIEWDNGKEVALTEEVKDHPDFWKIIEVILLDAHKEGGIVALRNAERQAMQTIEAMKKNKKPLIIT